MHCTPAQADSIMAGLKLKWTLPTVMVFLGLSVSEVNNGRRDGRWR